MFNFLNNKKEDNVISFVSLSPHLMDLKMTHPKQMSKEIPSWWKNTPRTISDEYTNNLIPTVKACPSFTDYFSQGFVLPAWTDVDISYRVQDDVWSADYPGSIDKEVMYNWGIHPNEQFLKHADAKVYGNKPTMVFKANSPWSMITKPGWSVLQLPLFYHFDNELVAMPGIIDTDISHQVNIQLLYFGDNKKVSIKQGQPLVHFIPFKRSDITENFDVRSATEADIKKIMASNIMYDTKFAGSGVYRKQQKERDSIE